MNYKVNVIYCGANYHGWAKQINQVTIQGTIENIIKSLFNIEVTVIGSGRTDAKVNATGQIFNFKTDGLSLDEKSMLNALRSSKIPDIYFKSVEIVDNDFHARYSAKAKTYQYTINTASEYNVFERDYVYQYNRNIDVKKLEELTNDVFIGRHDFLSFSTSELRDTTRTINFISIDQVDNYLIITINGDGFLRNMVRMIVGTMLSYSIDKITLNEIKQLLSSPRKGGSIYKAPGCGLSLIDVEY